MTDNSAPQKVETVPAPQSPVGQPTRMTAEEFWRNEWQNLPYDHHRRFAFALAEAYAASQLEVKVNWIVNSLEKRKEENMQSELDKFRQFKEGDLILVACALPCEWVIHSSSDPSTATYVCSGHLKEMLDGSKEHHIFPHDGAYENAPVNCCFILPTRQLSI